MKKPIIFLLAVLVSISSYAQMTEGNPSAKKIRTGNRPVAGYYGIYLGATSTMFEGIGKGDDLKIKALPLINFKYMSTDRAEWRLGLELYSKSSSVGGTSYSSDGKSDVAVSMTKSGNGIVKFYPGFAYHFSPVNILDIYTGVEVPIGFDFVNSTSTYTLKTDAIVQKQNKTIFNLGVGAFVGMQVFIANLPIAAGLEYGLSVNGSFGNKNKITHTENNKTETYYCLDNQMSQKYSKLVSNTGILGQQFRITLSYYFK